MQSSSRKYQVGIIKVKIVNTSFPPFVKLHFYLPLILKKGVSMSLLIMRRHIFLLYCILTLPISSPARQLLHSRSYCLPYRGYSLSIATLSSNWTYYIFMMCYSTCCPNCHGQIILNHCYLKFVEVHMYS